MNKIILAILSYKKENNFLRKCIELTVLEKNRIVIYLGGIALKRISALCLTILLLGTGWLQPVHANERPVNQPILAQSAKSAYLMEQETGRVLFAKNENRQLAPASMTKIMTMLLIFERLYNGSLKLNEKVAASEFAASMGGSQIFLEPGEEMTVDELLRGIAIASGNDAAVVMAERIAGTEEEFVRLMNERAKDLGLKNTVFKNCTGLPVEGHVSTAHDMAVMARELLKFEQITKYSGLYEDYLREDTDKKFWLVNTNKLVKFYTGCDGLKTGYTDDAKYCLTATAKRNDMRVIGVVMGAETSKIRNAQMMQMLDYAFGKYETKNLLEANVRVQSIEVQKGNQTEVDVVTAKPLRVLRERGTKQGKIEKKVQLNQNLQAPMKKGEKLGKLVLEENGKKVGEVDLVTREAISKANFWDFMKRTMGQLVGL